MSRWPQLLELARAWVEFMPGSQIGYRSVDEVDFGEEEETERLGKLRSFMIVLSDFRSVY